MKLSQKEKDELMDNVRKTSDSLIEFILVLILCIVLSVLPFIL